MTNPWIVVLATLLIIGLSAFFVIIEFSLMGARSYRLEEKAGSSRSARAALRGTRELTIMLAGAQLGITACTFALGAVTKPAVDAGLTPAFEAIGLPVWLADIASFVLSLLLVTFLHLVVGEMAPKSWAIAHPERAAMLIGIPARAFIWVFRPLLTWINTLANRLVAASGAEPVDRAAIGGRDAATIRRLVEHSAEVGALDDTMYTPISGVMELESLQVQDLIVKDTESTAVDHNATAEDIQAAAIASGHLRILVHRPDRDAPDVLHVRDTLTEPADRPVTELSRPAFTLAADTLVHHALTEMRRNSEQLAAVMGHDGFLGIITFNDAISRVLPRHEATSSTD